MSDPAVALTSLGYDPRLWVAHVQHFVICVTIFGSRASSPGSNRRAFVVALLKIRPKPTGRCSLSVPSVVDPGRILVILLLLIALLVIVVFSVGFTAHWLFVVAAVLVVALLFTFVLGTRNGRSRGAWR